MADPAFTPFWVGGHRCIQRLSVGRSGELYAAVHTATGMQRALRRLSAEVLNDDTLAEVVLRNLERIKEMEHPNILAVHQIVHEEDDVFVVMDLVRGVNMLEVLTRIRETAPLSPPVATFVSSQICQALDYARHLRVEGRLTSLVHGALSPTNVLLGYRGEILVTDFGAWVIPTGMQSEGAEYSVRTQFSYRSPEHVNGSTLTSASDIFCVGVLLHEMLTGERLFLGESLMETLELVENATVEELDGIPPALEPVVRRCLEREPADRFSDPASLISELSGAVPRAGSREVRNELVSFLEAISRAKGEAIEQAVAPESLEPEPILASASAPAEADVEEDTHRSRMRPAPPPDLSPPSVAPLSPLPGLQRDETPDMDEPTNINPAGVTEALVALSKDTTDPGSLDQIFSQDTGEEEEPTRIDPIIPGITGPESELPDVASEAPTGTAEVPTPIAPPVDQRVLWDSPDDAEAPSARDEDTRPQPVVYPPFPPSSKFVGATTSDDAEESTVKTSASTTTQTGEFSSDEEPTFQGLQLESITPPPQQVAVRSGTEDEPTVPVTPSKDPSPAREEAPERSEEDDDEPTLQAAQPPPESKPSPLKPVAHTLPWPGLEPASPEAEPTSRESETAPLRKSPEAARKRPEEGTPGIEALARDALQAEDQTGEGELEFSYDDDDVPATPKPAAPPPEQAARPQAVATTGGFRSDNTSEVSTFDRSDQAPDSDVATFDPPGEVQGVGPFNQHGAVNPESYVSSMSQFDGDSSVYSLSMDQPRSRYTAAHLLLLVAIIVFLVAVGLLVRRLVLQSRHRPRAVVHQVADAGTGPRATSLSPDGSRPAPKKPEAEPRSARTKTGPPVHSSGKHLTELLEGKLEPGMLAVTTTPPATLYVDGKRVGVTPLKKKVRPGDNIKLAVVAKGYEIDRKAVDIPLSRGMNLKIQLRKASYPRADGRRRGWLRVRCRRRDRRRILLNGGDTGFSCPGPVTFRLRPGRYTLGFAVPATGKTRSRRVRVRRGRRSRVRAPRRR